MSFWKWSRLSASNATSDPTSPWPEGMAPSQVNDSSRGMMAAAAKYRDDMAGAIITGGTLNAYTVASYQGFDTLAHLDGQAVAFSPHAANGATVTLNVDGLGAKPLRLSPGVELQSNVLIQGTPYVALYNSADAAFYLRGMGGNAYGIPLAGGMDFWGATAPSSAFAFPVGQAISRTAYAALFSIMGTAYGAGDGTTTFNLPDKRGRVSAAADASAGRLTGATVNSVTAGGVGGGETSTLITANLPPYTPQGASAAGSNVAIWDGNILTQFSAANSGLGTFVVANANNMSRVVSNTWTGTAQGGASAPFTNIQPTIICNYIIRII